MIDDQSSIEEAICFAIDSISGATTSRTGPFITGYISLEGPEYPNELFREDERLSECWNSFGFYNTNTD